MPTESASKTLATLLDEASKVVVGQRELLEGLLVTLVARGHALVEGVPGLAKTTAVRTIAKGLGLDFGRIQFTPDLLPGDLTGSPVFVPGESSARFEIHRGPVFRSVLLADEINRAPAKVQSALLEAMEERQVTIGDQTLALPRCFFVMATQNPIELEGTYALPEAQLDRFTVKLLVSYPSEAHEREIVDRNTAPEPEIRAVADEATVVALQNEAEKIHVEASLRDYAVAIVRATRSMIAPSEAQEFAGSWRDPSRAVTTGTPADAGGANLAIALGASPRASIALVRIARARALLEGRDYTTPHDVKRSAHDVLRHRIALDYEAEADGVTPDAVITRVLESVDAP